MLDVQRYRGAKYREEIEFTRKVMWAHLIFGAVVIAMFLFHEIFRWFAGAMVWYALTLVCMYGFMSEWKWCRWLLAAAFAGGTGAGIYFLNHVFPELNPPRGPLIPHSVIPLWIGLVNLVYFVGALLILFSQRIRKAGEAGFMLW